MAYRIGSFNMCKASFQSTPDSKKHFDNIASIIRNNFDIVAIQEIMNEITLKYLKGKLGPDWDGRWAQPRQKGLSPQALEGYAFLWNTRKFRLPKQRVKNSTKMEVAAPIIVGTDYYRGLNGKFLIRNPYYGRFIPVNGPFCELRLINTHIRFGESISGSDEVEADNDQEILNELFNLGKYALRRNELKILTTQICEQFNATRKNGRAVYTFLLGDYNLEIKNGDNVGPFLAEVARIEIPNSERAYITVQSEKTTLRQTAKVTDEMTTDEKYSHNFDHFTFDESLITKHGLNPIALTPHRVDTLGLNYAGDVAAHRKEISDHVPICMNIDFKSR